MNTDIIEAIREHCPELTENQIKKVLKIQKKVAKRIILNGGKFSIDGVVSIGPKELKEKKMWSFAKEQNFIRPKTMTLGAVVSQNLINKYKKNTTGKTQ